MTELCKGSDYRLPLNSTEDDFFMVYHPSSKMEGVKNEEVDQIEFDEITDDELKLIDIEGMIYLTSGLT